MKIKLLMDTAKVPTQGTSGAAGWDLYAAKACAIEPDETVGVHTGIALEIPEHYWGGIYARSGLAIKQGLRPANAVGVIDADYRGEIIVALHNDSSFVREIEVGDRIAQFILHPVIDFCGFSVVDELSDTKRGAGGFGSTGKK
jgi:dUTP pyrophosphatase